MIYWMEGHKGFGPRKWWKNRSACHRICSFTSTIRRLIVPETAWHRQDFVTEDVGRHKKQDVLTNVHISQRGGNLPYWLSQWTNMLNFWGLHFLAAQKHVSLTKWASNFQMFTNVSCLVGFYMVLWLHSHERNLWLLVTWNIEVIQSMTKIDPQTLGKRSRLFTTLEFSHGVCVCVNVCVCTEQVSYQQIWNMYHTSPYIHKHTCVWYLQ